MEPLEIQSFVVRDVWNGGPVADLAFALNAELDLATREALGVTTKTDAGEWLVESGPDEQIRVLATHSKEQLRPIDASWRVADLDRAESDGVATIWVYKLLQVVGSVRAGAERPPLRLEDVELFARSNGANTLFETSVGDDLAASESWLAERGFHRRARLGRADARGEFSFEIPRLPATTIRARVMPPEGARSSGWRDATYLIPDTVAASGVARVSLVLERGYEVSGRVMDEDGHPVEGARVVLHVVHYVKKEDLIPAKLRVHGHSYTARWNPSMARAVVDYKVRGTTDADGRFALVANTDGELTVSVAPVTEHHIANVPVGRVSSFDRTDAFTLRSTRGRPWVKLVGTGGASFAGLRVGFADLSYGDIQPTFSYTLGADARLPSRYLVEGHRYSFTVFPKSGSYPVADSIVTWDGSAELEIGALRLGTGAAPVDSAK